MLEERRIYQQIETKKSNRKLKKLIFVLLFILLILIGVVFYNLIIERSYPQVNKNEIISDLNQLTPGTKKLAEQFLARCEEEGLPVIIYETYRTQERQDKLYAQGRETEGNRVTWTTSSVHTKRRAFDIIKAGPDPYGDLEFFERCAEIGEEVGLEAGHYWRVRDSGHFQNNNWWN